MIKLLTIVSLVLLSGCDKGHAKDSGIAKDVTVKEFQEKLSVNDSIQLVDVRTPQEWKDGLIKGAQTIDIFSPNFEKQIKSLDTNKAVLVYCRSGGRSGRAMKQMQGLGFKEVYNLTGGIGAWMEAELPITKK